MASGSTGSTFPRWQLALLLGAPVALTLGYLYYKQSSIEEDGEKKGKKKLDGKAISIDDSGDAKVANGDLKEAKKDVTSDQKAVEFKNLGNAQYKAGKYDEAIAFYDLAIENCPTDKAVELSTFYQNRAAAYEQLQKWSMVEF